MCIGFFVSSLGVCEFICDLLIFMSFPESSSMCIGSSVSTCSCTLDVCELICDLLIFMSNPESSSMFIGSSVSTCTFGACELIRDLLMSSTGPSFSSSLLLVFTLLSASLSYMKC